jgi:putative ABC transport system substrate-binding protein
MIAALGSAAAWPLSAHAQQSEPMRRIGVLSSAGADDTGEKARLAAFEQALHAFGRTIDTNVRIDYCWAGGDPDRIPKYAAELVALAPDVILSTSSTSLPASMAATRTLPIVFVRVADPVGAGFVQSLARPGGNVTGFIVFEYGISGKWLELLKEIAPGVRRVVVLRDPRTAAGIGQYGALQSAAPSFGVELSPIDARNDSEIERAIIQFAKVGDGGSVVTGSELAALLRDEIVSLAARNRLPTVYSDRYFVDRGGLISYGPDRADEYRRAAGYVDRILKGANPADLPVQAPTKYELLVNLKTAKAIGLELPATVLARADEVIE